MEKGGYSRKHSTRHWKYAGKWGEMASSGLAAMLAVVALVLLSAVEWRGSPHTVVILRSIRAFADGHITGAGYSWPPTAGPASGPPRGSDRAINWNRNLIHKQPPPQA